MASTTTDTTELFRRVLASLNDRAFDRFAATHADDVVLHDHDQAIRGVEAAVDHQRALYEAFPDMQYEPETVIGTEGAVAARWTITGTHEGEFEGIPPTGAAVAIQGTGMMTVADGEVSEVWLVYDRLGLLEQLGVVDSD